MPHLGGDFAQRAHFSVYHHVGLLVVRLALGKHLANCQQRIGLLQKRPMALVLGAFVNCFRIGPQTNNQRVLLETGQVIGIHNGTAAGGNHQLFPVAQFINDIAFQLPEDRLALGREYFRDGNARAFRDQGVRIHKLKAQLAGDLPAHGGFAAAHEADEGKVGNDALTGHALIMVKKMWDRTPVFRAAFLGRTMNLLVCVAAPQSS